jgi:iron complex outermembrane recepter protein
MKSVNLAIGLLATLGLQAQQHDSLKTKTIKGVILHGQYYKNDDANAISGALRLDTSLLDMPQNVQVIGHSAMADQQIMGISDGILRNVSGATRLEHWGDMYANINMRGSRAAAFLNGNNVSSTWGPLAEDMSYVDKVEFVKGPAGFMMSNGEPGGLYNVLTKKAFFSPATTGQVASTLGAFGLYRAEADVNTKINKKLAFRLNVMGQNRQSFRDHDYNHRYIIAPTFTYKIGKKTTFTAEYIYQKAIMAEVGAAYIFSTKGYKVLPQNASHTDPGLDPTKINEHYINLNLKSQLSDIWQLTTQISHLSNGQLGGYIWPEKVEPDGKIQRKYQAWEADNQMTFGQAYLNAKFKTNKISHKILTGLDVGRKHYLADWGQSHLLDKADELFDSHLSTYQAPSNGLPTGFDFSSKSLRQRATPYGTIQQVYTGFYLQDEIGFLDDKLRLTLAARMTDVAQSSYGAAVQHAQKMTPRLGLSATLLPGLNAYALYDQAFMPQAGVLRTGKAPSPITGDNMEIGLKKDWLNGKLYTGLTAYRIIKNNELIIDPDNADNEKFSIIKGQSQAKGIEFDMKGELFDGLNLMANYAFTDHSITQSNTPNLKVGDKIAGYAKHNMNTWLTYTLPKGHFKGFGAALGFTFMGDRSSWNWSSEANILKMDDYRKWDAGLSFSNKKVNVNFMVFNLLGEYLYSGTRYAKYYHYQAEAPTNYRLTMTFKF